MKKPILLSILLLATALVRAEAPQSDYARDMLLGPVQYVIQQGDTLLRYGADGRKLDNRIEKTTFDGDTRTDEIWGYWPTYTFDERGRVVKVAYSGGETEYRYKGKGYLPVWMKESYEEGDMGDERTVVREGKLSYPRVDDRGNWLERRFDGETTVRQIVYFDASTPGLAVSLPPIEKRNTSIGETATAIILFIAWGAMLATHGLAPQPRRRAAVLHRQQAPAGPVRCNDGRYGAVQHRKHMAFGGDAGARRIGGRIRLDGLPRTRIAAGRPTG